MPRASVTIEETGDSFTFDNIVNESYEEPVEVAEQTIDEARDVATHAKARPETGTIVYEVTESAPEGAPGPPPGRRVVEARDFLKRCKERRVILTTTNYGALADRLITDVSHGVDNRNGAEFSVSFTSPRFARAELVEYPDDLAVERHAGRAGSEAHRGRQPTDEQGVVDAGEDETNRLAEEAGRTLELLTEGT